MSSVSSSILQTNCSDTTYTCGTCKSSLPSPLLLHRHLLSHGSSYRYNDIIKVAFTINETTCKATQTNVSAFPETYFENIVNNRTLVQNAEQLMESLRKDENDKVYTELSGSPDLLKRPSNSGIVSVANIAVMEAENDDLVSDVCSFESDSTCNYLNVICKDVKKVSESVENSAVQNVPVYDDTRTMLKTPASITGNQVGKVQERSLLRISKRYVDELKHIDRQKQKQGLPSRTNREVGTTHGLEIVETKNRGEIFESTNRWEMVENSNTGEIIETTNRGEIIETTNRGDTVETKNRGEFFETTNRGEMVENSNTFETAHKGDTIITKVKAVSVDSEHDIEKQNNLFYGNISLNNYHVQCDRPRGEFNFGERDEFMRVHVRKTWAPHSCLTTQDGNCNNIAGQVCEHVSVDSDLSQIHSHSDFMDDMSKKSTILSGKCYSPSGSEKSIGDTSGNSKTINENPDIVERGGNSKTMNENPDLVERSGNSKTMNENLDIVERSGNSKTMNENLDIVEHTLTEGNNDVGTMRISDGIPLKEPQQLNEPSLKLSTKHQFGCVKCGKSYSNKLSLEYHTNNHLGRKQYLCQSCGHTFSSKKTLNIHWLHHHGEKQFECSVCHVKLPSAARLREHASTHVGIQDYTYICSVCNKKYKSARYLRQHVQYSHKMNKKECKICCKVFSGFKEYSKHTTICSRKPFVCEVCNKMFSSYGSLRRHGAIHTNHRPHECHICYRRFLQKGPYWIHMLKHHDLTKDDLIRLFPEKHADRHSPRVVEKVITLPVRKYADKNLEFAENERGLQEVVV